MAEDIRWEQRFMNFKKALTRLQMVQASDLASLSDLEKEGLIQRFEYTLCRAKRHIIISTTGWLHHGCRRLAQDEEIAGTDVAYLR